MKRLRSPWDDAVIQLERGTQRVKVGADGRAVPLMTPEQTRARNRGVMLHRWWLVKQVAPELVDDARLKICVLVSAPLYAERGRWGKVPKLIAMHSALVPQFQRVLCRMDLSTVYRWMHIRLKYAEGQSVYFQAERKAHEPHTCYLLYTDKSYRVRYRQPLEGMEHWSLYDLLLFVGCLSP
jgi:hypothetical protein